MRKVRTAALVSGGGSNLQALIDAALVPDYPTEIALVVSNVSDAYALKRARMSGIPAVSLPHGSFPAKPAFEDAIQQSLEQHRIDLVCLAGFMRLLSASFVDAWKARIINIHPSLLPDFKGLHTHARAIAAGKLRAGCTVHFVTPEMDDGPIIQQRSVAILPNDTPEALAARVIVEEHLCYVDALRIVAERLQESLHRP